MPKVELLGVPRSVARPRCAYAPSCDDIVSDSAAIEYDRGRKDYDDPRVCQNCVRTEGSYRNSLAYVVLNTRTGKYHASAGYGQSNCGLDMTGDEWMWPSQREEA